MGKLRIGTCSWKYPSWAGLVYSSPNPANHLEEYARKYSTVEIDQWFWSLGKGSVALPLRGVVAEYDASTPADFRFTVKCPNALTLTHHPGRKGEKFRINDSFLDPDLLMRFVDSLAPLVPKISLLILQFPYQNRETVPSKEALFDRLRGFFRALPADLPYAVELRNPRWIDATWFDLLRELMVAPVFLQGYWMDDTTTTIDRFADELGPRVCLRLHGEDREGMERGAANPGTGSSGRRTASSDGLPSRSRRYSAGRSIST